MKTIAKYNPVIDHFFNGFLGDTNGGSSKTTFVPAVEVAETDKDFELSLFVPGLKKEDFKLELEGRKLIISGERKSTEEKDGLKFHIKEVRYGKFSRTFSMPRNVNQKDISASYVDGVLKVLIPKDETKALCKRIEVK